MASYTIKSNFNGDIRRTTTSSVPTLAQLASLETSMYRFSRPVTLKYLDEEGDAVTLANDDDVATAFAAAAAVATFLVHVVAVEAVSTTVAANINSPITTVADNPITAVPIDTRVASNAPVTAVPVVGNAVTTTPISDVNTNISPITNSPVIVTNFDGSSINNTVVTISDVNVVSGVGNGNGNGNAAVSAAASVRQRKPFVVSSNSAVWLPILVQLAQVGFSDTQRNVELLNHFGGNYLAVLSQLVLEFALKQQAPAQSQ